MTYEEIKEHGLEEYFAKPGDICQRVSDGKYVKVSEDGHPVLLTEEELEMYTRNGVVQTRTSNPFVDFGGGVLCTLLEELASDYLLLDSPLGIQEQPRKPSKDDVVNLYTFSAAKK